MVTSTSVYRLQVVATCRSRRAFGRIDVGTTGIQVSDDGHTVGGEYTGGRARAPQVKKPNLQVVSGGGNVYIGTASAKD